MPVGQAAERLVVDEDLTGGRLVESADKLQQSTFARAASASDSYEFASENIKANAAERWNGLATDAVRFGEVGYGDVAATGAFLRGSIRCNSFSSQAGLGGWR